MKRTIKFGQLDVWVIIPTITLDFHFKGIGFVWLKWCVDIRFNNKLDDYE